MTIKTDNCTTIHWLGAGLSSAPGIRRIVELGHNIILWNRTLDKALQSVSGLFDRPNLKVKELNPSDLQRSINTSDIVVSMLPATMHTEIAEICITKKAHLVTTSYISDAMKALDSKSKELQLSFINEVGLDPGIDHWFAHLLVDEFKNIEWSRDPNVRVRFDSLCGGIPKIPNDFFYKFSWSPAGVLRALQNPARYVDHSQIKEIKSVWDEISQYKIGDESFEVYPNRDSTQFISQYEFSKNWNIERFIRGTIRLKGWSKAWSEIFLKLPQMNAEELQSLSSHLWSKYQYKDQDQDRVVLWVSLNAKNETKTWRKSYLIDECGSGSNTAMAKLVSIPATLAVESILNNTSPIGVSAAPKSRTVLKSWISKLTELGISIKSYE